MLTLLTFVILALYFTGSVDEQRGVRRAAGEGSGHTQQEPQPAAHVYHRCRHVYKSSLCTFPTAI